MKHAETHHAAAIRSLSSFQASQTQTDVKLEKKKTKKHLKSREQVGCSQILQFSTQLCRMNEHHSSNWYLWSASVLVTSYHSDTLREGESNKWATSAELQSQHFESSNINSKNAKSKAMKWFDYMASSGGNHAGIFPTVPTLHENSLIMNPELRGN